jgi:hypothetical protein
MTVFSGCSPGHVIYRGLPVADNSDLGRKILIAGQGGKSTLARAIAVDLGLP